MSLESKRINIRSNPVIEQGRSEEFRYNDPQKIWRESDGKSWSFENGAVLVEGRNLNELINENMNNIGFLNGISISLSEYRNVILAKKLADEKFNASTTAIQGKIARNLSKIYDEKKSGISARLDEKALRINGIDPEKVARLYQIMPTDKARVYLEGVRDKLNWIKNHNGATNHYDAIRDKAKSILAKVDDALKTAPNGRRLVSAGGGNS